MPEQEYPLQTLLFPTQGDFESLLNYPAIELFVSRAQKINPTFKLTAKNSGIIVGICQYLDGLPLALELAAFRLSKALLNLQVACFTLGEIEESKDVAIRLVNMATTLGHELEKTKGLLVLGFGNMFSDLEKALTYSEKTVQGFRQLNNAYWLGLSLWQSGVFIW